MIKRSSVVVLIGLVLALCFPLTACGGVSDSPYEGGLNKTDKEILENLVFTMYDDIFEVNSRYDGLNNLTNTKDAKEGYVTLSHDGTRIAYIDYPSQTSDIIYVMDRGSLYREKLNVPEGNHADIAWSPDDKQLVYVTNHFGSNGVSRTNYLSIFNLKDGTNKIIHTASAALNDPSYSPDGKTIIFSESKNLYTILIEDKKITQITDVGSGDWYTSPIFSPNGKKIAFLNLNIIMPSGDSKVATTESELFIMDKDGSNIKQITHSPYNEMWPVWNQKGDRIIYAGAEGDEIYEFLSVDPDNGDIHHVFDVEANSQVWAPTPTPEPTPTEQAFVEKTITSPFNAILRQVYLSETGRINAPKEEGKITVKCADVSLQDFMMEVVFLNPSGISYKEWSDGLLFRKIGRDNELRIILYENKWSLYNRTEESVKLASGEASMNLKEGGSNRVKLIALSGKGYLYVNDVLVQKLDLSKRIQRGDVCISSQLWSTDLKNVNMDYLEFSVWDLDPN